MEIDFFSDPPRIFQSGEENYLMTGSSQRNLCWNRYVDEVEMLRL
jgi:hypothetical protein